MSRDAQREPASAAAQTAAEPAQAPGPKPQASKPQAPKPQDDIGRSGELLRREEAFDLVRRAANSIVTGDAAVPASALRRRAFEILGRDSETLSERFFNRVLRDAHDADLIDLRRRGDDFEVALPSAVPPVAEQLNRAAAAHATPVATAPAAPVQRGMGPRGIPARGRGGRGSLPPELLMVGVVETGPQPVAAAPAEEPVAAAPAPVAKGRGTRAKAKAKSAAAGEAKAAPKKKAPRVSRAKKTAEPAEKS